MTPLHHAALCGSGSCVRQLLALGANAALLCGGAARLSAAHLAAAAGSVAGLDALLDAQPSLLGAVDGSGRTPLDIARSLAKSAAAAAFLEQQERERAPESAESATESAGPAIEVTPRAPAAAQKSVHASISTMEIQNVNRWGFVDPNAQQYAPTEKDIRKEVERGMKWMQMFQQWDKFAGSDKLHERVDKGIPDAVRGLAWTRLTMATREVAKYAELLAQPSEHAQQIKKDIHRTFPKHILFRDAEGAGQQSLFNVLKCFAVYDKETGYCVPEDHEILTSRGFLDLDAYEAAAAADPTLLVASYNVAAKALVFEKPNKLVQFADDDARARRALQRRRDDARLVGRQRFARHRAVRPVQRREHARHEGARRLCATRQRTRRRERHARQAQGGRSAQVGSKVQRVRQLAVAEAGVQCETVPDFCDELGLRTAEQRALFYEIYGFWLRDGTLRWHGRLQEFVVTFSQVNEADNAWLEASLTTLEVPYIKSDPSPVGQVTISIQSEPLGVPRLRGRVRQAQVYADR
jgi:hypothetical protein